MSDRVTCDNNIDHARTRFNLARWWAANYIATKAQVYAMKDAPVYEGEALGPHIKTNVEEVARGVLLIEIGADYDLVAYGEVGTATLYEPPEAFIENLVPEGHNHFGRRGISQWWWFDSATRTFKEGHSHPAHHFLQRAIIDHAEEYARDLEEALTSAEV